MAYASSQSKGDRAASMLKRAGYASGGAVKKGKSVTVNVFSGGGAPPMTPPMMGPPMIPPGMPPPGMPPPGMGGPPPRAMMKKGGAVAARDVHKHERNMHKGKPLTKLRTGGKVKGERTVSMDAGAGGGLGRLEKAAKYGKRGK